MTSIPESHARGDAVARAGRRPVCFHDLRHTFGTRMAAARARLGFIQEWMQRDYKTTSIYADHAADPSRGAMYAARALAFGVADEEVQPGGGDPQPFWGQSIDR